MRITCNVTCMIANRTGVASPGGSELPGAAPGDTVGRMPDLREAGPGPISLCALKLPCIVVATAVLCPLIVCHAPGIDGPWYAHYGFHRAPAMRIYPLMALCALPLWTGV